MVKKNQDAAVAVVIINTVLIQSLVFEDLIGGWSKNLIFSFENFIRTEVSLKVCKSFCRVLLHPAYITLYN